IAVAKAILTKVKRMGSLLVAMGAVRPVDDGVLQEEFVVRFQRRQIVRVLQAKASELARVVFEERRLRVRRVSKIVEIGSREQQAWIRRGNARVAQANAPLRHELVKALCVPAPTRLRELCGIEEAALMAVKELAREREIAHDRISFRRPFVDEA